MNPMSPTTVAVLASIITQIPKGSASGVAVACVGRTSMRSANGHPGASEAPMHAAAAARSWGSAAAAPAASGRSSSWAVLSERSVIAQPYISTRLGTSRSWSRTEWSRSIAGGPVRDAVRPR